MEEGGAEETNQAEMGTDAQMSRVLNEGLQIRLAINALTLQTIMDCIQGRARRPCRNEGPREVGLSASSEPDFPRSS